ncbi:hypothetical protein ACLOJK_004546, partial [Asimina triloba]
MPLSSRSRNCLDRTQKTLKISSPASHHAARSPTHLPTPLPTTAQPAAMHDAIASLARCQLPAIPHIGNVGKGVSRPQQTTVIADIIGIEDIVGAT